jgi:hypothetical protein
MKTCLQSSATGSYPKSEVLHTVPSNTFNIHFNAILSYTPRSSKGLFLCRTVKKSSGDSNLNGDWNIDCASEVSDAVTEPLLPKE